MDFGAGVALAHCVHGFQFFSQMAIFKGDGVSLAVTLNLDFNAFGKGIDHRHTHAVQPPGKVVIFLGKFCTGMQFEEDDLHAAGPFDLRVFVDGHAAPVIGNFQRAVLVQHHINAFGIACNGFIHAVVDDLLGQVVGPACVGIHAGTAFDRFQTFENLDGGGVVIVAVVI